VQVRAGDQVPVGIDEARDHQPAFALHQRELAVAVGKSALAAEPGDTAVPHGHRGTLDPAEETAVATVVGDQGSDVDQEQVTGGSVVGVRRQLAGEPGTIAADGDTPVTGDQTVDATAVLPTEGTATGHSAPSHLHARVKLT